MKKPPSTAHPTADRPRLYERLSQTFCSCGWISEGYVQDRGPGAGGPHYQWTRKVKGKTITVALSESEYDALAQAIANERKLNQTIRQMEQISRRILFTNRSQPGQRKPLRQKVLGLI